MGVCIIPELHDAWMPIEHRLHDRPLHAAAAPVHETDFTKTRGGRRIDVFFDDGWNFARRECVEIDFVFDRDANGLVSHRVSCRGTRQTRDEWP